MKKWPQSRKKSLLCGALWKKSNKHGKDYLTGQLDLGVLGKVQIADFQNPEKQNEQSPDATIHLFEED